MFFRLKYAPDLENPSAIIARPDAQDILSIAYTEYSTTNFLASVCKLIANKRKDQFLPVPIRNTLLQLDNPLATFLVLVILPNWPNVFLEHVVIRNHW